MKVSILALVAPELIRINSFLDFSPTLRCKGAVHDLS
jgi:hypothetical protein